MSIFKNDNKLLKFNGKFFNYVLPPPPPTYKVNLLPSQNGVITADNLSGTEGTLVTLSNTPNTHYSFGYYSLTGANLSGNQFYILDEDVSAKGTFIEDPKYTLKLQQSTGGTITANKLTGYNDESATLSYTANQDYYFNNWSTTGSTVQNNKVPFTQNTTAKGNFVYTNPLNVVHATFNSAATTTGVTIKEGSKYIITGLNNSSMIGISGNFGEPIIGMSFDIKNNITTTSNMHVIHFIGSRISAWRKEWNYEDESWRVRQYSNNNYDGPGSWYEGRYWYWPAISANRCPIYVPWLSKQTYVNTTNGWSSGGIIYAKCDNWFNKHNKLKFLMHWKSGPTYSYDYDRSCFVSAYYDNNFIASSWQNLYNIALYKFSAFGGLYSATHDFDNHSPVGGSIKLDVGRFSTEDACKKWLEVQ